MTDELVSIVVAVYNNREDLDRCIQSILKQTYSNLEVILVSDHPTDGSEEICKQYAALDSRVQLIIHEQNQGVKRGWQDGVQAANGKYVGFVDADDYIDPDLYEKLMSCKEDFDLITTRWWREEKGKTRKGYDILALGAYTTQEDMDFLLEHMMGVAAPDGSGEHIHPGFFGHPGIKLYKTEMLCDILENIQGSITSSIDVAMTSLYLLRCKSVLITDICGYHYQIHGNSNTHASTIDKITLNVREFYHALAPHFMAHPRHDILMLQLQQKVANLLNRGPIRMKYPPELQNKTLVFPLINRLDNKRIALCGAGRVGQNYWLQIQKFHMCQVGVWVDRKWEYYRREGRDVSAMEQLLHTEYDYVVIAVFHEELADEIRKDLLTMGIEAGKILWKAPLVF
ncbi:MAG: glycosyltransferase [Lawsonibacter sp.]|nr:glycosyltransferase [Lawsonibacter sp.]